MKRFILALLLTVSPLAAQTTKISVQVIQSDTVSVSIVVLTAFLITTNDSDLPDGIELLQYTAQLVADNVPEGHTVLWSIDSGSLPPGLSLDPETGIISGITPAGSAGLYPFVIRATTIPPPS